MNKLLIICGLTATGKTALGVKLAKIFDGELISADSRQVYRGMDIGTGKDIPKKSKIKNQNAKLHIKNKKLTIGYRLKDDIPIWLVDIVEPDYVFNVGEYKKLAKNVIQDIQRRNKLPIIVGGTGLYIRSLLEPLDTIIIPPSATLRQELNSLTTSELQTRLQEADQNKFASMNRSDQNNPRRLVRAIEVVEWKKNQLSYSSSDPAQPENREASIEDSRFRRNDIHDVSSRLSASGGTSSNNNVLLIGLTAPLDELFRRIDQRVDERMKQGILEEVETLLHKSYTWDLPSMSGLGYKEWKQVFSSQLAVDSLRRRELRENAIQQWKLHEKQYAKRQMTYLKKLPGIVWFDAFELNHLQSIEEKVQEWYTKKRH